MSASLHPTVAFVSHAAGARPDDGAARGSAPVLIAMAAGLVVGGLAFGLRPAPHPAPPRDVEARVGGQVLHLPAALVRAQGPEERIDLALRWPDLGPAAVAGSADRTATPRLGNVLLVTLMPAAGDPSNPDRLGGLYARFLDAAVRPGPSGLIERRFKTGTPYENKALLFSPPDGRQFMALCDARPSGGEVLPPLCTARFERAGLSVQVRFEPGIVEAWDRIQSGLLPRLDGWIRAPADRS